MACDQRCVAFNPQALAKPAYIAPGVTRGKAGASDPVPGYIVDDVRALANIDQRLQRDFAGAGPA